MKPARKRINVAREVAEQLEQEAALSGVKTNQLLKELLEERENSKDLLFGLNPKLRARILKEAERNGLTIEEVLEKYFPEDEEESDQAEEDKDDKNNGQTCTVEPQKIKRWLADLEDLIKSHDREIWLACMLLKLSPWQLVPL